MRWIKKPQAKLGDTRTLCRFLWTPKTIGLEVRWLEKATWKEMYARNPLTGATYWKPFDWVLY
jgi:hypothetical protein